MYENIVQLKLPSPDGKMRMTDVATSEQLFRIIQSIPSPKAKANDYLESKKTSRQLKGKKESNE